MKCKKHSSHETDWFTQEGILRSNCSASDGRRDSIVLSILKPEWNQQVKTHLQSKLY